MRVLYISLVDVSVPYGPGVNERSFLRDMHRRFGSNFLAVLPRPEHGIPADLQGLEIEYLSYFKSSRTFVGWVESRIFGAVRVPKIIKTFKPDLIVMRTGALCFPEYIASRVNRSVRYVLKTAGSGSYEAFYRRSIFRRMLSGINDSLHKKMLDGAGVIDVVSEMQYCSMSEKYPEYKHKAFVIDNGVDTDLFNGADREITRKRYGWDIDTVVLGYAGTQPFSRGGKEVIDCISSLRAMNIAGLIIGDSGQAKQCFEYARQLGISDRVRIVGQVDYSIVPELMAAMDVGLSILRAHERHASEQKVRQYFASGVLLVGTCGSNDLFKGYPFAEVIASDDMEIVLGAIRGFVELPVKERMRLSQQAKQFANDELSVASKNDIRLRLWQQELSKQSDFVAN